MRKRNSGRILSRPKNQRKALLKSLATSLILHGKLKTTEAKAKELRIFVEKNITKGKSNSLASKRSLSEIFAPKVAEKLVKEVSPKYATVSGGYTRIIKLGARQSDGAKMVIIELI